MPANTECISQPAINSASSIALCMECTVDSILTTTPFFSPRERLEPIPIISISSSGEISPTMATTLDVPISSPTIKFFSVRLPIFYSCPESSGICCMPRHSIANPFVYLRSIRFKFLISPFRLGSTDSVRRAIRPSTSFLPSMITGPSCK